MSALSSRKPSSVSPGGSRLAVIRGLAVSSVLAATHVLSSVLIAFFAVQLLTRTLGGAGRAAASRGHQPWASGADRRVVHLPRGTRSPASSKARRRHGRVHRGPHSVPADALCHGRGAGAGRAARRVDVRGIYVPRYRAHAWRSGGARDLGT